MPTKSFSVRVPKGAPDVDGAAVAGWLDGQIAAAAPLAPDPGAGEKTLRLSLDAGKVKDAAKAAGEPEAAFLRRLIASNADVPGEPPRGSEAKPKPLVLRGNLRLRAEQLRPAVAAYGGVQSYLIRRALKAPDAVREASLSPEESERLAASTAEVLNRRAPAKLAANIDVLGLAADVVAISWQKVDAVRAAADRRRRQKDVERRQQQGAPAGTIPATDAVAGEGGGSE